jgi:hypothetical protein
VALGLGIYNLFDVYMFAESAAWNWTCVGIGLVLLLLTRTLYANAGLTTSLDADTEAEQARAMGSERAWQHRFKRFKMYVQATGGVVGACVLWKGLCFV